MFLQQRTNDNRKKQSTENPIGQSVDMYIVHDVVVVVVDDLELLRKDEVGPAN